MTEPIQLGRELSTEPRYFGRDLTDIYRVLGINPQTMDRDEYAAEMVDAAMSLKEQIRLINSFWDEVAEIYDATKDYRKYNQAKHPDSQYNEYLRGRQEAFEDILKLSAEYPFG